MIYNPVLSHIRVFLLTGIIKTFQNRTANEVNIGHVGQNIGHVGQNIGHVGQNIGHVGQNIGHVGQNIGRVKNCRSRRVGRCFYAHIFSSYIRISG